jgi:hypothetical protein
MTSDGQQILLNLQTVAAERLRRRADPGLDLRVRAVKHFQHSRFENTYADLLGSQRYARAARFFLDDLYGPHDFTERDGQFERIVPALVRLFPHDIVQTVRSLSELHALSESMDTQMASSLWSGELNAQTYAKAWQLTGQPAQRERQIALMLSVGEALDRYTRNPLLRHSLRLMRGPARAAGLGELQGFLERGFDTFREMRGAKEFLGVIALRERALAEKLFCLDVSATADGTPGSPIALDPLSGQPR